MDKLYQAADYLIQGGWVMTPLMLCSVFMWTLIAERLYFFHGLTRYDIQIREAIRLLEGGKSGEEGRQGLRSRLVNSFLKQRTGNPDLDKNILYHCALKQRPLLNRYLAAIAVLASIAPLLGLLGTVIGMVQAFNVISLFGTGNVKGLSSGISAALITTQSGLIVAIPGLFLCGYLYRRASRQELRLEEITAILMRHV